MTNKEIMQFLLDKLSKKEFNKFVFGILFDGIFLGVLFSYLIYSLWLNYNI